MTNDRSQARGGLVQQAVLVVPGNVYRWVSMAASDSGLVIKAFCQKTNADMLIWEQGSKLATGMARQNTIFVIPAGVLAIDVGLCFMDPTEPGHRFQVMATELLPFEDAAARTFGQIIFAVSLFTLVVMALTAALPSGAPGLANKGQWESNAFSMLQQLQFVVICARLSQSPIPFQFFAAPFRCPCYRCRFMRTLCRTRHRLISHAQLYHICLCSIAIFEFPLPWDNHMYSLPTSRPYSPDSPADVWTTSHLPKTLFWNTVLFAVVCSIHAVLWAFQYIMTSRDESSEDAVGGISFPMHALRRSQSAYSTLSGAEPSAGEATRPELVCIPQRVASVAASAIDFHATGHRLIAEMSANSSQVDRGFLAKRPSPWLPSEQVIANANAYVSASTSSLGSVGSTKASSTPAAEVQRVSLLWPRWEVPTILFCYPGVTMAASEACMLHDTGLVVFGAITLLAFSLGTLLFLIVFLRHNIRNLNSVQWSPRDVTRVSGSGYLLIEQVKPTSISFHHGAWDNVAHRFVQRWGHLFAPFQLRYSLFRAEEVAKALVIGLSLGVLQSYPLAQVIVITVVYAIHTLILLVIRPFNWMLHSYLECVSSSLNTIAMLPLLANTIVYAPGGNSSGVAVFVMIICAVTLLIHVVVHLHASLRRAALAVRGIRCCLPRSEARIPDDETRSIGSPQASPQHQSHASSARGSPMVSPQRSQDAMPAARLSAQGSYSSYGNGLRTAAPSQEQALNIQITPAARESSSVGRPGVASERVAPESSSSSSIYSSSGRAKLPSPTMSEVQGADVAALSKKSIAAAKAALSLPIDHSRRLDTEDLADLSAIPMTYEEEYLMGSNERHISRQPSRHFMDHIAFDQDASDSTHWKE